MKMRHPETGGETDTTQEAFDEVWAERGWVLVSENEGAAPAPSKPKRDEVSPNV